MATDCDAAVPGRWAALRHERFVQPRARRLAVLRRVEPQVALGPTPPYPVVVVR